MAVALLKLGRQRLGKLPIFVLAGEDLTGTC